MTAILFRQAATADIPDIQRVRHAVKENRLSDPALAPDSDVADYIHRRGRGWVAVINGRVEAFAIVSIMDKNVWALFVNPSFEAKGLGRQLHQLMMDWYFSQTDEDCWLSTDPQSRAAGFYRAAGWKEAGTYGKGELKFILTSKDWQPQIP